MRGTADEALRRQVQYLASRERRGRQTAYDEVAHSDVEALAQAIQRLASREGQRMSKQDGSSDETWEEAHFLYADLE